MEAYIIDHKNNLILDSIRNGLTPEQVTNEFNKQAACLHEYCDDLLQNKCKTANIITSITDTLKPLVGGASTIASSMVPLAIAGISLPSLAAYMGGKVSGKVLANLDTERNEMPINTYQKLDEISQLKAETKKILDRVEAKKKQNSRVSTRSVRQLF